MSAYYEVSFVGKERFFHILALIENCSGWILNLNHGEVTVFWSNDVRPGSCGGQEGAARKICNVFSRPEVGVGGGGSAQAMISRSNCPPPPITIQMRKRFAYRLPAVGHHK